MTRRISFCASFAIIIVLTGRVAVAGDLAPPAGPVAPTMKTLSEIEPRVAIGAVTTPGDATSVFKITQTGSYYLTADVVVPSGKSGILIAAPNVSIDLRGFRIVGEPGSVDGIADVPGALQVQIHDGSILFMGNRGFNGNSSLGSLVRNLTVRGCGWEGIQLPSNSTAEACTGLDCAVGVDSSFNCTLRDCTARDNSLYGIGLDGGSTAENCAASFNPGGGFRLFTSSTCRGCVARNNGGHGYYVDTNCQLMGCIANFNSGDGFHTDSACSILNCTGSSNSLDGIEVGSNSRVSGCLATDNIGSGVLLSGTYGTAESNMCRGNSYGVRTAAGACLVIRNNVASAATANYSFVAATRFGPIVNAVGSAGVVNVVAGGSLAGSFTATDPNANLSY